MKNKYRYTKEQKLAILQIVDGCEMFKGKEMWKDRYLLDLLLHIFNKNISFDSFRRNIKRWRAELEPMPYVPIVHFQDHLVKNCDHVFEWLQNDTSMTPPPGTIMVCLRCKKERIVT